MNAPFSPPTATAEPFRFTVDQFIALHEQGLFDDYAKSELIEGEIVVMNAQWSRHARVKTDLAFELGKALRDMGSPLRPQVEVSIRLSDGSLPEPDITLTDYRGDGAVPLAHVALVIEVSDSTLETDLGRKSDLYAAAGIAEYWVIDLNENRALMHENPDADGYHGQLDVLLGERLVSATIEGLEVDTETLLD
ncbi:Uma2 family endonuclease [Sphingomonas sp. SUN039]|uniref:Uma2 family endonuclease n=1 Tax=Sphingomonas sp. SUN039 TaxID=2937787 RepID=UPI0021644560|nr:Uma2 family endonuclease [Sphingomonas sp. SUN039]UVO53252.1 Uma2 family endonuclease [Sphingomonas sp. SUN039]